jgi:hypothetical protein
MLSKHDVSHTSSCGQEHMQFRNVVFYGVFRITDDIKVATREEQDGRDSGV